MSVCVFRKNWVRDCGGQARARFLQYLCAATRLQSKCTATVQTADHMYTECTVLFSLAQAHFTNQTISMQN